MKTILVTLIGTLAVITLAGLVVIYSGVYDVAASNQDSSFVRWVLSTTRRHAVDRQAQDISIPATAQQPSPEFLRKGFVHYDEMCVGCHAAPGVEAGEIQAGLNPRPPRLAKLAENRTPAELFWVIKHGIKMTGMPAWGATHDDEEIWAVVSFVKKLPELSPAEYQSMRQQGGDADHRHEGHAH